MAHYATESFAMLPCLLMDAVPRESRPEVWAVYMVMHRRGWGSRQGCWASVPTISEESGVGLHSVRGAIRWLLSAGWLVREERPGSTSVYRVKVEAPDATAQQRKKLAKKRATPSKSVRAPLTELEDHPFQNRKGTPSRNVRAPLPILEDEPEPSNQTPLTRKEVEPLVFPASGEADRPEAAIVSAVPDPPPAKARGSRKPAAFSPTAEDIDVRLLPVERQIMAFWAGKVAAKKGATTKDAWLCLQAGLLRIQQDPDGGTHVVAEQLDAGIQAGWSSVTYANWQRYGKPARMRYGSQTAAGPNGEGLRGSDAFDFMRQELRRRQAQAEQEHTQPTMRYAG